MRILPALAATAVLASLLTATPAHADAVSDLLLGAPAPLPPQKQAFFTNPPGYPSTGSSSPVTDRIVQLVQQTSRDANVHVAMYFIQDDPAVSGGDVDRIIAALSDAVRVRRVNLQVVVDSQWASDPAVVALEDLDPVTDNVHVCIHGCYGTDSTGPTWEDYDKLHNKYLLIDDTTWTTGKENVVAQSSANWSDKQLRDHYENDLVVIRSDTALYNAYVRNWNELRACVPPSSCSGVPTQSTSGTTATAVHFAPRPTGSNPQATEIDNVSCASGTNRTIRIAMGAWDNATQGTTLRDKLIAKKTAGCTVQIVVQEDQGIVPSLDTSILDVRCTADGTTGDGPANELTGPSVHTKYMLVDGTYDGVASSRIVFTGSQNFTQRALRQNDEAWLKVTYVPSGVAVNLSLYSSYVSNFNSLWSAATDCSLSY